MEDPYCPRPIHAIVMPVPLQGHVIPAVNLALKLASNGFTITFINNEIIRHKITTSHPPANFDGSENDIFCGARECGLDIRHRTVGDGFPLSFDRLANDERYLEEGQLHAVPVLMDELVGDIVKEARDPPVSCLIADGFFTWPSMIAEKYDLVFVSFWTEPALVFTLYYHLDLLKTNGHYASHDNREDTIDYIPGVKAIEPKDLPSYLQETDVSTVMHRLIDVAFKDVKRADFVLCNTVEELESKPISALQEKQPFYAIGPLFPSGLTKGVVPTSLRPESNCTQWLNTKPHGSVLYVSFGSFLTSRKSDIDEIALGLALSKVNFIWVLRHDVVSYEEPYVLPIEFEEVKDRGLTVTWTNQAEITNKKLIVDDWKIGLNLSDGKPLTRFDVAAKINRLMSGKSSAELKTETMKDSYNEYGGLPPDYFNGKHWPTDNRHDIIDYIPGVKAIESKDLPSYLQETDVSTIMHRLIDEAFKDVEKADFILCNTIEELELEAILALQEKQPFYAIGPLPSGFTKGIVPTSLRPESNCTQWLNTKGPFSSLI
ncbi:UDP-glycosyltransferase 86A1 [Morus notabilis]|uniref:UDP-glycosyltransferase 86A1 n=1 Tax=Morus notabilis TaxID=981085 RepID=W9S7N0_9ROSA|nr:UDP-glycosyltransferase 86A1 [Morus notabilis]